MKKLILLFSINFILSCCNRDDDRPVSEIDKLPSQTQTGANTAGCLVNGQAFVTKGNFPGGSGLLCNYIDGKDFTLSIAENVNGRIRSIVVTSFNQNLHNNIGVPFQLNNYGANSKCGEFVIFNTDFSEDHYQTNSTIVGELIVTYHNYDDAIISGIFWYDAVNSDGVKVEVRNGRFDMQY